MAIINFLRSKIVTFNLFDTKSTDAATIRREILSTRLFLILYFISIFIISLYNSLAIHIQTETVKLPTQIEYEKLLEQYSDSLQCPCTQISIPYNKFTYVTSSFHQVCSSDFVTQLWFDFAFGSNSTFIWPMDVRTSMSAMWQLIAALCQYANNTLADALDEFANTPLISSMILSESLLRTQTQTMINLTYQTASDTLVRSFTAAHQITLASGFLTGLLTNFISLLPTNGWQPDTYLYTGQNRYVRSGSTTVCFCQSDQSCPMPGNLYLYNSWETYGLYDLNTLIANETLPGLVVDCLPIQTMLASSLECFYNQSCLEILLSAYSKSINVSILNESLPSHFLIETTIEQLMQELFIEEITNEIVYKSYYAECNPAYCTYLDSQQLDLIFVVTSIIGLIGGFNVALRLISPYLIDFLLRLMKKRTEPTEFVQTTERLTIQTRFRNLLNKIKLFIIELNIFNSHSRDILRTHNERISTRFYIIFIICTMSIFTFYTFLSIQTISKTIQLPLQDQYEKLQEQYPHTLTCPCTKINIPYEDFIEIIPIYHQLCSSDFIQPWWYKQLVTLKGSYIPGDFRLTASSYFQMLAMFCELANLTFIDANRSFSSRELINSQILSRNLFDSQIEALNNTFLNSIQVEFAYTLSMINTVLHANQYVSSAQTNAILVTLDFTLLGISSTNPLQIYPFSTTIYQEDNVTCICAQNSSCTTPYINSDLWKLDGIRVGCFIMDAVLQSSLICWYNESCFNEFQQAFASAGVNISNNISLLDMTLSNKFLPTTPLQTIVQEIMVTQWNTSTSYENFYKKCRPIYCKYTYKERGDVIFIVTTMIGLFGGLDIILRLISPFFAQIFVEFTNRFISNPRATTSNNHQMTTNQEYRINIGQNLFQTQVYQKLARLNLFDSDSNQIDVIHHERLSTRLYIILLFIIIFIQIIYYIILTETKNQVVLMPSQVQYENLYILYSNRIQCPCTQISIKYKDFITIDDPSFHQICSSDFVNDIWINFLFANGFWAFQVRSDLRGRGAASFRLLAELCKLSVTTINNAIDQFLQEILVSNEIMSEEEFSSKINITLGRFKNDTPYSFSRALQLVRDITNENSFISTYLLNWEWQVTDNRSNATVSTNAVSPDNTCSCGKRSDCINSGGIYRAFDNTLVFSIVGFNVGCSALETLFRSTFECLYNQTCIDQLQYFATYISSYPPAAGYINAMNSTYSSRFLLNTTIDNIVNQLFIEQWNINVSYSAFYQQCAPTYCSYTYQERNDFLYIVTQLLAIYGGLTIALRLITPRIIKLVFSIQKCGRRNTIAHHS